MTLVEFIAPLAKSHHREKCLAILYFNERYNDVSALTVDQIRAGLRQARVTGWKKVNVADVLAKSGHFVDTSGVQNGRRLWKLTPSGQTHIRELLRLPEAEPEVEHDAASLEKVVRKIADKDVQGYLEEAVKCLRVGALRAAVVFLWSGAIRTVQEEIFSKNTPPQLNAAIQKHDPKARVVSRVDDFAHVKDKDTLLAARDLGRLDKGEHGTLDDALSLRNRCGHPTRYKPGVKKVSGFIEDIIGIVFS